jgi:hypothetical protein
MNENDITQMSPKFWDHSKHKNKMVQRWVRLFVDEVEAERYAMRLRAAYRPRKGFSRSTRVVRKIVNVHGFSTEVWYVTHRVRGTRDLG